MVVRPLEDLEHGADEVARRLLALEAQVVGAERPQEATDEAMLIEWNGGSVLIHPVAEQNLKVTTPLDLRVAELLLAERG